VAKASGLGQRLFCGGFNVSGDIGSIDNAASPVATLDVTGIDKSAMERIGGLRDGALDYTAFFNPADDQAHEVFSALPTTDVHELYCTGTTLGDPAAGMLAKQINYDGKRGNDGSLTFTVQSQAAAGTPLEWGRLLTAAPRTDTTATNGAGYDFGAAGTAGLAAYLQVLGFTGTSCTIKIQESSDDDGDPDTWADVTGGSFGAQSAVGASRIQTSTSLAVERYLRVVTTGTFSSCAFVVLVVRY
jgi:hypothetical protein